VVDDERDRAGRGKRAKCAINPGVTGAQERRHATHPAIAAFVSAMRASASAFLGR
jgi:hypothetical protein